MPKAHVFGNLEGTEGWDGVDFNELLMSLPDASRGQFQPLQGPHGEAGCSESVSELRPDDDFYDDEEVEYFFPRADPCPHCEVILSLWRRTGIDGDVGWWTESGDPVGKADDWSNREEIKIEQRKNAPTCDVDPEVERRSRERLQRIADDLAKNEWALRHNR